MTMTAKFDGRCKSCGGDMPKGTLIHWTREQGASHATLMQCNEAKAIREQKRQALYVAMVQSAPVVDVTMIVAFLAAARERGLKAPKARFVDSASREITLALAKETSRNPGAVYVTVSGDYVGKIAADGRAVGLAQGLVDTLAAIAVDPAKAAKAYAALMGRCSFCALPLTDAGSVDVGYGPVCAKKYGLPHTALGTPAVQRIEAA